MKPRRAAAALAAAAREPRRLVTALARLPLEQAAAARIATLPVFELADLAESAVEVAVRLPPRQTRHSWSLGAVEQLALQVLVRTRHCSTAFEIGTFNGGTTRLLAESLPDDGRIWTIDLPPPEFDATQAPAGLAGADVGSAYRDSPAAFKITQLFGDSTTYDFDAYAQSADLVLVDAGHEYANGVADTRAALELVRPGGIVLWDDFEPYWDGLVHGICDAMSGRRFGRLAGTSLAVHVAA